MKNKIIILLIVLSVLLNIVTIIINLDYNEETEIKVLTEVRLIGECSDNNIINLSYCLKNKLRKFYYYNLSNAGEELTENRLREEGGVCLHYAEWYKQQLIMRGANETVEPLYQNEIEHNFYVTTKKLRINNKSSHIVTIVSNDEAYCVLDMLNVGCVKFSE